MGSMQEAVKGLQAQVAVDAIESADEILAMSVEEMAEAADQAQARKTLAQTKAAELDKIQQALEKVYAVRDWEFIPQFKAAAERLVRQMEELGGSDDVQFALLVHRVKTAALTAESVREQFAKIAAAGRCTLANAEKVRQLNDGKKYPTSAVVFRDLCALAIASAFMPDGEQSMADRCLFEALRRLVSRFYAAQKKAEEERVEAIRKDPQATDRLENFLRREPGLYRLYQPEKVLLNGRRSPAGVMLFELAHDCDNTPVVVFRDGAGSLAAAGRIKGYWLYRQQIQNAWQCGRDREKLARILEGLKVPHEVRKEDEEYFRMDIERCVVVVCRKAREAIRQS